MLSRAKPSQFTKLLTPDKAVATIEAVESVPQELLRRARMVHGSYTWVTPEKRPDFELKWLSEPALADTGLADLADSPELAEVLAGHKAIVDAKHQIHPFAQNYAGDQFGSWAGQLGDGRVITLFNVGGYELQLKGAGLTPYSRFADGKAVLRSSIREALASEYLNRLGVPTQRCLSLVALPSTVTRRERVEPCAVVARFAPSWVRIGSFQLHHSRGDRSELRKLADYCINVLKLGADPDRAAVDKYAKANRYFWLFRDSALRNARMMAQCQSYGFLNGVLNTDNVSILGLSMDYGPFAFMDTFDSYFTPNHDDHTSRYGFRSAPVVMWWNFVKLGEALGELIGAGADVDSPAFVADGLAMDGRSAAAALATDLIMRMGDEYQHVYESSYQEAMMHRLGIFGPAEKDDVKLLEDLLRTMEECEVDYNRFFRLVAHTTDALSFLPAERERKAMLSDADAQKMLRSWFARYEKRLERDQGVTDRVSRMDAINPNFVLKNSVLANVIELAERGNWDAFHACATMALDPFATSWNVPEIYEQRYQREVPLTERDSQLSCSS